MSEYSSDWDELNLWLETHGFYDDEAPVTNGEKEWIGHPNEWSGEDVPEPPPNFVEEHWEADTALDKPFRHSWGWETWGHLV